MCCFSGSKVVECRTRAFSESIRLCSFVTIISLFVYLRGNVISLIENPRKIKRDCSMMVGEVSVTVPLRGTSCPTRRISGAIRFLLRRIGHLKLKFSLSFTDHHQRILTLSGESSLSVLRPVTPSMVVQLRLYTFRFELDAGSFVP